MKTRNQQIGLSLKGESKIVCAIIVDEQNKEHGSVQEVNQWSLS